MGKLRRRRRRTVEWDREKTQPSDQPTSSLSLSLSLSLNFPSCNSTGRKESKATWQLSSHCSFSFSLKEKKSAEAKAKKSGRHSFFRHSTFNFQLWTANSLAPADTFKNKKFTRNTRGQGGESEGLQRHRRQDGIIARHGCTRILLPVVRGQEEFDEE